MLLGVTVLTICSFKENGFMYSFTLTFIINFLTETIAPFQLAHFTHSATIF